MTYRYWDWNRTYDASGRRDPNGAPRALDAARALAVTRWSGPHGAAFLAQIRHRAGNVDPHADARFELLCGSDGPLVSSTFRIERLSGNGTLDLPARDVLTSLTVLDGHVKIGTDGDALDVVRGRTAALPPSGSATQVTLDGAHAVLCAVTESRA